VWAGTDWNADERADERDDRRRQHCERFHRDSVCHARPDAASRKCLLVGSREQNARPEHRSASTQPERRTTVMHGDESHL